MDLKTLKKCEIKHTEIDDITPVGNMIDTLGSLHVVSHGNKCHKMACNIYETHRASFIG